MKGGAEGVDPRDVRDVTVVELDFDDEAPAGPIRRRPAGGRSWIALPVRVRVVHGVGVLALCALSFIALPVLLAPDRRVDMDDVERSVRSELSGELLGDLRVDGVSCARETESRARCIARLFDKSGIGPISQRVAVRLDRRTSDYVWHAP